MVRNNVVLLIGAIVIAGVVALWVGTHLALTQAAVTFSIVGGVVFVVAHTVAPSEMKGWISVAALMIEWAMAGMLIAHFGEKMPMVWKPFIILGVFVGNIPIAEEVFLEWRKRRRLRRSGHGRRRGNALPADPLNQ